jgi:hypothetical protein
MGLTGLIWLRIGTSGGLLWTRLWTFGFRKILRNSWVAAQLAASQEGRSSAELVSWPCYRSGWYSPASHCGGPWLDPRSGHVGFVVDKVAMRQVFSEYFGFPCQSSYHRLLHTHHISSGAGTIGQLVADVPSALSLTPPQETKRKLKLVSYVNTTELPRSLIFITFIVPNQCKKWESILNCAKLNMLSIKRAHFLCRDCTGWFCRYKTQTFLNNFLLFVRFSMKHMKP